jgi:general secretion pathway protein E/type IV pilus assembly protein PilB
MRQDPDIIFIGEVRDSETANMALRAAITGHQVYTTLHTNDALGAIPRLIDIGIKNTMLAGAVICVVAQRLVRKLCSHCKIEHVLDEQAYKILRCDHNNPPKVYMAAKNGCEHCEGRGHKGRVAIAEILPVDRDMDELIASNATRRMLLDHALSRGFLPMAEDGIKKILAGITSLEEVVDCIDMTDRM